MINNTTNATTKTMVKCHLFYVKNLVLGNICNYSECLGDYLERIASYIIVHVHFWSNASWNLHKYRNLKPYACRKLGWHIFDKATSSVLREFTINEAFFDIAKHSKIAKEVLPALPYYKYYLKYEYENSAYRFNTL